MDKKAVQYYRCPATGSPLSLRAARLKGEQVMEGVLESKDAHRYPIKDGIPDFTYPQNLSRTLKAALTLYEERADVYDQYLPLTFFTFGEDEQKVRSHMADKLSLKPHYRVLDMAAGSGRDSVVIAGRLNQKGSLYVQDLSLPMLRHAQKRLEMVKCACHFGLSNGAYLPFPDHFFDAVFSFGGLGEFDDIRRAFAEMARVTRPGGKIVAGDENLPVWLRGRTEFANILLNYNKQYAFNLPLEHLPVEARKVNVEWIIGGVFFLIDFEVGAGEPYANFDFDIPGARGGTHRTRYAGQMEGVTPETKELAYKARAASGKSMHAWLDAVVREAAEKELARRPAGKPLRKSRK